MHPKKQKFSITHALSLKTFWGLSAGLILLRFLFPCFETHDGTAFLSWDVCSHYLWLPAFFIHDDPGLNDFGWIGQILRLYQPLIGYRQAIMHTAGSGPVFTASMGMALLFAPFFLAGHIIAIVAGFPADGFSVPYQVAAALGGLCWSILGMWFLRKVLLCYFSEGTTAATMIFVLPATGYYAIAAFHGGTPENLLFSLYLVLLYVTIRYLARPSYALAAVMGLTAGLIFLVRPFDGFLMLPWLLFLVVRIPARHLHLSVFSIFCFLSVASLQMACRKLFSGHFYNPGDFFLPQSVQAFSPYLVVTAIPSGYLIRYFSTKKLGWYCAFLFFVLAVACLNLYKAVANQQVMKEACNAPARYFYRYDHEDAIPASQQLSARTWVEDESELLDHPQWFKTRRIFSQKPGQFKLDEQCRFSPGISAPVSSFSNRSWIGLQAKTRVFCPAPATGHAGNLVITVLRDNKVLAWKGTPLEPGKIKEGQWNEFAINCIIRNPQKNDLLQAYFWYTGKSQVMISSCSVTLFEKSEEKPPEKPSGFIFF